MHFSLGSVRRELASKHKSFGLPLGEDMSVFGNKNLKGGGASTRRFHQGRTPDTASSRNVSAASPAQRREDEAPRGTHFAPSRKAEVDEASEEPKDSKGAGARSAGDTEAVGNAEEPTAQAQPHNSSDNANTETLRRERHVKRCHPVLRMVGIGCGSLLGVVLVFVAIFAIWLGGLGSSMGIEDEGERRDLEEALVEVKEHDEAFYVLVLGRDARPGEETSRSDVNMLVRVDPETATVSLVSIPRDTMVTINESTQKINAVYAFAGAGGAVRCVSQFAGVPISHFVSIDFEGLVELVDMLGGVWVDVPQSFSTGTYSFQEGEQLMSGDQALAFVRDRYHVSGGDFGRAQAQRLVVEAIMRQVLSTPPVELPGVISELAECITTDLSVAKLIELGQQFLGRDVTVYSAICPSYTLYQDGVSYVATMFDEWRRMMQLTDAGLDPNSETAEIPLEQRENEELGAAPNSPAPRDYQSRAENAMTTDDVADAS